MTSGGVLTIESAITCDSSPVIGLISILALSASVMNCGSFMVASKARCGDPLGRHARRGDERTRDCGLRRHERHQLAITIVAGKLDQQRHVGKLAIALEAGLRQDENLLLREPLRLGRFPG